MHTALLSNGFATPDFLVCNNGTSTFWALFPLAHSTFCKQKIYRKV